MSQLPKGKSLLDLIKNALASGKPFFSVELLPGTTMQLNESLQASLEALSLRPPLFASITWHNSHSIATPESEVSHPALELANELENKHNISTLLHLAAGDLNKSQIWSILNRAQRIGVRSIFAIRGNQDPQPGADFSTGTDLVRFIREKFGTEFTVGVAGYPPSGHSDVRYQQGLRHLKDKVDAGADFVITQVVWRAKDFLTFVEDCQSLGINVPIIPGLLVTKAQSSIVSLERMAIITKTPLPPDITDKINSMQNNPTALRGFIDNLTVKTVKQLMDSKKASLVLFFTLNRVSQTFQIWDQIKSNTPLSRAASQDSHHKIPIISMHN